MAIRKEVLDELLKEAGSPDQLFGKDGLIKELTARLVERVLEAELSDQLGYEKHSVAGRNSGNSRNGHGYKTIKMDTGQYEIQVPRDRNGEFESKLIPNGPFSGPGQSRMPSLDEKILSLYARGMTTREIQGHSADERR